MPIPGKIFLLLLGWHYAVEATICKESRAEFPRQGEVFLEYEQLPRYCSKIELRQLNSSVMCRLHVQRQPLLPFALPFVTPRETLRLGLRPFLLPQLI